jgi:hypothetical protein
MLLLQFDRSHPEIQRGNRLMFEFPEELDKALQVAAKDRGLRLMRETHYDAINREIRWFKKTYKKELI